LHPALVASLHTVCHDDERAAELKGLLCCCIAGQASAAAALLLLPQVCWSNMARLAWAAGAGDLPGSDKHTIIVYPAVTDALHTVAHTGQVQMAAASIGCADNPADPCLHCMPVAAGLQSITS
jgi:hypothetical protein